MMKTAQALFIKYLLKKAKVLFLRWLTTTPVYKYLLKKVVPYIRFSTYYTKMRGRIYHKGYELLQPGDVILTRDKFKLTTKIIGGRWSHAALCVSKDKAFEVAEMTHKDYTESTFADLCFEADEVAIIRCRDINEPYIQEMVKKCRSLKDAEYDVEFKFGEEFLYCSELIYESDFEKKWDVNKEDLVHLGRKYVSPTAYWNASNRVLVWHSKNP